MAQFLTPIQILFFCFLVQNASVCSSFLIVHRFYPAGARKIVSIRSDFPFSRLNAVGTAKDEPQSMDAKKKLALDLLDCLTSPKDPDESGYDVEKDIRRDNLLQSNTFESLKVELKRRGLNTAGDKIEMIVRMLLHTIDPSIDFTEM